MPEELTKEDLQKYKNHHLTVGRLKEFIEKHNLPNDALVMIQRIEDVYFEENHWSVYLKDGMFVEDAKQWNIDIDNKFLNKEEYPNFDRSEYDYISEEEIKELKEQYHPAFSCVRYNDDTDLLFIDLHY